MTVAQVHSLPIHSDPEIMGGTPVFVGTRVPVRTVFDYLADGSSLDEFLDDFPTVSRQNAVKVLEAGGTCLEDIVQTS
ncbi:MAG: DUF433 domain-containing protein [Methylacidiphilales bacterium]|nr:DUF433 domain-containing protein [Candidatus Methylacidiphilales bacterium]